MPDQIINDHEIKSDEFSISINSLILLKKPNSVLKLNKALDDNGYYGRYKILRKVTKKHGETVINIEVYLPNSRTSYLWPFKTLFNLTLGKLVKRSKIKSIPAIKHVMAYLASAFNIEHTLKSTPIEKLPDHLMEAHYSTDLNHFQYIVTVLIHAGLIVVDENNVVVFKLRDTDDIEEVYSNLFNPDNYLD